jgi:putative sugar O-methyltransferase
LRYVKILSDIKQHFGTVDNFDICEIGVGYGGQCRIINAYSKPATYCLVDIHPALGLARRFLDNYVLNSVLSYKTMNELAGRCYDLVISNYAFSELPRDVQNKYLDKVILNSAPGYITYNDINPKEFNSHTAAELIQLIPGARIFKERPLTHPGNCIIVWANA